MTPAPMEPVPLASDYVVFADESGTHAGDRCFGIGALVIPSSRLSTFNDFFQAKKTAYKSGAEPCWTAIDKSYGDMNLAIDLLKAVLAVSEARFSIIAVKKSIYHKWATNKAEGFWIAYHYLLTHLAALKSGSYHVILDPRTDPYPLQNEILEIVGNHALQKLPEGGSLQKVEWGESETDLGIQAVDLLTGAIVGSHNLGLDPNRPLNFGKQLLISRLATVLGWSDLFCDTIPNDKFNIWHFPDKDGSSGWRAHPATREVVVNHDVPHVTWSDLFG
jgi:hypothetical protein